MQKVVTNRCAHPHLVAAGLMVLLGLVAVVPGVAQDSGQSSVPTPAPTPQPTPIPASDIPARAADSADTARRAVADAVPDARLVEIQQSLPDEQAKIKKLREEATKKLKMPGPASMIRESEKTWGRVRARLDQWLVDLSTRSGALDGTLDVLQNRASLWRLTRDKESGAALPKAVIEQISDTIKSLTDAENQVRSARDSILDLQARIAHEKSGVDEMLGKLQQEIATRTRGVLGIDSPPLWKAYGADDDRGDARERFKSIQQEHWRTLKYYVAEQASDLLVWLLMWPALILLMVVMHRKAEVWVQQDKKLQKAVTLLSRPVSAALLVTALLNVLLQPQAPGAWTDTVAVALALAVLRVLPGLLPKSMRLAPYFVVLIFVLQRAVELAPEGFVIYRLVLLALAASGIAACVWLIRALRRDPDNLSENWHRAVVYGARVALVLFGMGAVADIIGSVDFSTLTLSGTAYAMLAATLMALVSGALRSMVRVGLLTGTARRIGIAPDHSDTVQTTVFAMISFFTVAGWVVVLLREFLLLDPLIDGIRRTLDWSISVGDLSVDPGDILIFGFVIWLSFKIAALVQFIFTVDLMPRVDLPKGVPETVSLLTRYAIIAVGAVIASAAAGLDTSRITIIIGALGVGVGFGLQHIVNNFVSGLILLFERPIRVGDTLDVGTTGGVVENIGMRASIVSTWDGAEVIIPNASLISENVTNWTLSHEHRRMVIPVGVAHGTDPEKAAQLIVDVANDHKDVDANPAPTCLFVGFGDSSLDFQLRAWTTGSAFMGVASDLRFAIVRKLAKAGIEIPFPQRDLHLRTADPEAASWAGPRNKDERPAQDGADGSVAKGKEETENSDD
jgi:potassium efflux system protein